MVRIVLAFRAAAGRTPAIADAREAHRTKPKQTRRTPHTTQTRDIELVAAHNAIRPDVGRLTFIGNATVLLHLGPFTVLTDPTFIHMHEQTWIGYGMYTTRLTNPAMDIVDLPPLDLIVL